MNKISLFYSVTGVANTDYCFDTKCIYHFM